MDVVALVREWVGTTPDDATIIDLVLATEGDTDRVALHLLRLRYADMTLNPSKWATSDDYSQDTSANLAALAAQIRRLENLVDGTQPLGWSSTPIVPARLGR